MGKVPELENGQSEDFLDPMSGEFVAGISASMRAVEAVIGELSQSQVPVLLLAEPGAGKHATARRIHEMSRRSAQPFRSIRCSALKVENLKAGQGEEESLVCEGTVFFRELADMNAACQRQLVELLPQVTSTETGTGLARFICGSSRDLEREVRAGRLREDLYYQISGVCLRLPPLRQRREDIPALTEHFMGRYAQEFRRPVPVLTPEMLRLIHEYAWPGNLKQLESTARALVAIGDERLALAGLRVLLQNSAIDSNARISLKAASRAASYEAEKELILKALTRTRWNRRRAAAELQISYKALLYKLKQIGCEGFGV